MEIAEEKVYCVPGNHDVDQDVPKKSFWIKTMQDKLANSETTDEFDSNYALCCRGEDGNLLFAPIENYNTEFAGKYGCHISIKEPQWKAEIELSEKYKVCMLGINSTIISNADDHANDEERLMFVNERQIPSREDNTIYLTLCHHPPECWKYPDTLKNKICSRVHIQLYGHKHIQNIQKINNSLIVGCGAAHPSRWEPNWVPRYNWITLDIFTENNVDYVNIKIFPRVLDDCRDKFVTDINSCPDEIFIEYKIPLSTIEEDQTEDISKIIYSSLEINETPRMISYKKLTYAFMNLPCVKRDKIIQDLNLGREEDGDLKHIDILDSIIQRAEEQECIDKLWEEIQKNKS